MKIASWNVNSINTRVEQVIQWLDQQPVDVLGLQELKCVDENFPIEPFIAAGWEVALSGQKAYNGVAFISRQEAQAVITDVPELSCPQRRIIAATFNGVRIYNVYVPNGQAVGCDKYEYKLDWLAKFTQHIEQALKDYEHVVVMGDFNIAPSASDVHDAQLWQDKILVSDAERGALTKLLNLGFKDSFRLFEQAEQSFSWWDYRGGQFKNNQGLRIDLILATEALAKRCDSAFIDPVPRTWLQPSDHAPVLAVFLE